MNIQKYQFEESVISVYDKSGEPWFLASEVCGVLGLENPRQVVAALDEDEKGVHIMDTLGGPQNRTIINESGLYSLVLRSRKPEAKRFKKWITSEVLPQIRKTGQYIPKELSRLELIELARDAEIERLKATQALALAAPKVEAFDAFIQSTETQHVGVVGKLFGIGEKTFFVMLRGEGILIRRTRHDHRTRHYNLPRQEYIDAGYFEVDESPVNIEHRDGTKDVINKATTKFTPRGIEWISKRVEKMKERYASGAYESAA